MIPDVITGQQLVETLKRSGRGRARRSGHRQLKAADGRSGRAGNRLHSRSGGARYSDERRENRKTTEIAQNSHYYYFLPRCFRLLSPEAVRFVARTSRRTPYATLIYDCGTGRHEPRQEQGGHCAEGKSYHLYANPTDSGLTLCVGISIRR